jgi:hypothetical protein
MAFYLYNIYIIIIQEQKQTTEKNKNEVTTTAKLSQRI